MTARGQPMVRSLWSVHADSLPATQMARTKPLDFLLAH